MVSDVSSPPEPEARPDEDGNRETAALGMDFGSPVPPYQRGNASLHKQHYRGEAVPLPRQL